MKELSPDKVKMFNDYDEVLTRIITEKKIEITKIVQQIDILSLKNNQLDQDLSRKQAQFDQYKRIEEQKLQEIKDKSNNDIIRREKAIEIGEIDLVRRVEEVVKREKLGMDIVDKDQKLNNDRMEVEKLRSSASVLMDEANSRISDILNKENQANLLFAKAKDMEIKANIFNDNISRREYEVSEKEKDLGLRERNLEEVKKIVDPKLKEIKLIEDRIKAEQKSLEEKENFIAGKIGEEKSMMDALEEKSKSLKLLENQLAQKDQEITRKILIAGLETKSETKSEAKDEVKGKKDKK